MRISDWSSDVCSSDLIIATALALDDLAVDPPRGDVVALVRGDAGEALVMAQIEVGLRPVVGDVDLAVLIGRHRARIDVKIRIELANPHAITAFLQQRRKAARKSVVQGKSVSVRVDLVGPP